MTHSLSFPLLKCHNTLLRVHSSTSPIISYLKTINDHKTELQNARGILKLTAKLSGLVKELIKMLLHMFITDNDKIEKDTQCDRIYMTL